MLMLVALGASSATAEESIRSVLKADAEDRFLTLGLLIDALNGSPETQSVFDALNDPTSALTVFAPTDAAIATWVLSTNFGTMEEAIDKIDFIAELLKYHVVGAAVRSGGLEVDLVVETLLSMKNFTVASLEPTVTLKTASGQTATITTADLEAGSSFVHIVDTVLDPKGSAWVFGGATRLTTTAVVATGTTKHDILVKVLTELGDPYVKLVTGTADKLMVVAPDDAAFTKFVTAANTTLDALLKEANMTTLKSVIDYHVFYDSDATVQAANGMVPNPLLTASSTTWMAGKKLKMLNKEDLTVMMKSDTEWTLVTALNQTVTSSLIPTSSGFLMPVTEVLSPTAPAPVATPDTSGASSYHVSMVTVASALMAVFVMVVAV